MKNTLIIILTIVTLSCTKEEEPYECNCNEPFFDPVYIDSLHLDEMPNFWDAGETIYSRLTGYEITNHIGFIEGKDYSNKDKYISVYVFQNRDMAVDGAMKYMANLSVFFDPGSENILSGIWWYSTERPDNYGLIFRLKNNAILQISNNFLSTVDAVGKEDSLNDQIFNVAQNIDQRIDNWSYLPY